MPLPAPTPVDTGHAAPDGAIVFPPWRGDADPQGEGPPAPLPPDERIGFALVGLGRLTLEELLPAFGESRGARPVALVSGSPDKMAAVARQYGIAPSGCYGYDDFDRIADNPAVQAVYIVLPNALHRGFTERAAAAGKHVLVEKPMATRADDARAMVAACAAASVRLMVAYRIQYQPHHLKARQLVREGRFGRLVGMTATNVQTVHATAALQWRHKRALAGGGALPDIGLYCLNTARFVSGEEPCEVFARLHSPAGDARFADVEQTVAFSLRFPSGFVAQCFTSYGARDDKYQRLNLERATFDMPRAYAYAGQRLLVAAQQDGEDTVREIVLPASNPFAAEIDHFARCIREGCTPDTPGEEGLRDQLLMEALYRSAREGRPVAMD